MTCPRQGSDLLCKLSSVFQLICSCLEPNSTIQAPLETSGRSSVALTEKLSAHQQSLGHLITYGVSVSFDAADGGNFIPGHSIFRLAGPLPALSAGNFNAKWCIQEADNLFTFICTDEILAYGVQVATSLHHLTALHKHPAVAAACVFMC